MSPHISRHRILVIVAVLLATLLILREGGIVSWTLFKKDFQAMLTNTGECPKLNAKRVIVERDDNKPFRPDLKMPEDAYLVTVRYRITNDLSPWRWLPFYKFGKNHAQLTYQVWMESALSGSAAITSEATLTMKGIASARDYESAVSESLINKMMIDLREKFPPHVPISRR